MVDIPWAQPTNPDFVGEADTGALSGLALGQKMQAVNALQGVDFNNPSSLDNAITGLTRAGATDQANALMNLTTARMVRSQILPAIINRLAPPGQQPSAPAQTAAPAAAPGQPQAPDQQAIVAHANETMALARQGVQTLQQTPLTERPQVFAQIKQQMLQRGIPEQAIDQAGEDLSDAGLQKYGAYLDAHNAAVNPAPGQQPGPMPDHPTGYDWAKDLLQDPTLNNPVVQGLLKTYAGVDVAPSVERAERIVQPFINKEADVAAAGPQTTATEGAKAPFEVIQTSIHGVPVQMAKSDFLALQKANVPGVGVGLSPEEAAAQTARGTGSGSAPFDIVHTTIGGVPVDLPKDAFLKLQAAGTPGLGRDLSPGEKEAQTGDAKNFVQTVANASDPNRQAELSKAITNGQMVVGLADAIGTGKYTQALNKVAQAFPGLKAPKEYATNASLLAQDLSASFKDELGGMAMPRLTAEANSVLGAIPKNTSPQDQVKLYGALMAGTARFGKSHDQFMVNYDADPSKPKLQGPAQAAWNNGAGRVGILGYAMPELEHMTINGRPAVVVDPKTGFGVFMPGTKQQFTFRAK